MRGTPFALLRPLIFALILVMAASILATPLVYADPNAPTVNVAFGSVNNGNSTPTCGQHFNSLTGFPFAQYRYGRPWANGDGSITNCPSQSSGNTGYLQQSGMGVEAFSNTPSLSTCTSQIFKIGKAWHFNRTIWGGTALPTPMTSAAWNVAYAGVVNGDINGNINFAFVLDETDNDPDNHPNDTCPYGSGNNDPINVHPNTGATACADAVDVVANGVFNVLGGPTCSIEVIGFNNSCPDTPTQAQLNTNFVSRETLNNSSCIYARVTAPQAVSLAWFEATGEGNDVRLNWETASEVNNLGFNLWRGTSFDNRVQLNGELIPAQTPGGGQGALYEEWDRGVGVGTFYYWLEDVDMSGNRTLHEPVSVTIEQPTAVTVTTFKGSAMPNQGWLLLGTVITLGMVLAVSRLKRA
jgi:hypothetical protein